MRLTFKKSVLCLLLVVFVLFANLAFAEVVNSVNADEDYVISTAGDTLKDANIEGDLIVDADVQDGEVTLDNVSVDGKLLIFGGNSIVIRGNSSISEAIVNNSESEPIRVKIEDEAIVGTISVGENSSIIVNGSITTLIMDEKASVELEFASVENVEVNGADATLQVDGGSSVTLVTIDASGVQLTGTGKVGSAEVTENAKSGVVIDTQGTTVTVADGAGDVTNSNGDVVAPSGDKTTTPGTPVEDEDDEPETGSRR